MDGELLGIGTHLDEQLVRVLELVELAWPNLAATAWSGYLALGRGFLLLDFSRDLDQEDLTYTPAPGRVDGKGGHASWEAIVHTCQRYRPEREIVVAFPRFIDDDVILTLCIPAPDEMPLPPLALR